MGYRHWYVVGAIILLAFGLRIWHITTLPPGLYPDEAMNGGNAIEALKLGHWKVFYPENNGREGLFMNIQAGFLKVIGQNEPWVLRFPSTIFGTLTVLGLFLLIYELGFVSKLPNRFWLATFSAFFLATSVWHIIFSRIGFRAIMAPFFLTWGLYFALLAFRRRWLSAAAASGLSFGLGFYSYIAFRIMPALLLFYIPSFWKRKDFWHIAIATFIVAVVAFLPLGYYFLTHPPDFLGRTGQVSVFSSVSPTRDLAKNIGLTLLMFNWRGDGNWRHNIAGAPEVFWPVGILLIIGAALAFKRRSLFDWLMLGWLVLAFLPTVLSNEGIPHALRSILMLPAVMALAGSGALLIYQWLSRRWRTAQVKLAIVIFFAVLLYQAWYGYFIQWGQNPNVHGAFAANYVSIARQINALPQSEEKYVVVRAGGVMARGFPVAAETVMFITDTFLPEDQKSKRVEYLLPADYEARKSSLAGRHVFFID